MGKSRLEIQFGSVRPVDRLHGHELEEVSGREDGKKREGPRTEGTEGP